MNCAFGSVVVEDSFLEDNGLPGLGARSIGGDVRITGTSVLRNTNNGVVLAGDGGSIGGNVTIDGLVASANSFGAGLDVGNVEGTISVARSTFADNGGAGLYFDETGANLSIDDVDADDNGTNGLAVVGGGRPGNVDIADSNFRRNVSSGVSVSDIGGNVAVEDVVASNNGSNGIVVDEAVSGGVDIDRVVANGNDTGLTLYDIVGPTTVQDSTISGSSDIGIGVQDNSVVTVFERVTLTGNERAFGGFLDGSAQIVNSTITGNGDGSQEIIFSRLDSLEIRHSTITGNNVGAGASVIQLETDSPVTIDHSIVTGNGAAPLVENSGSSLSPVVTAAHSLLPVGSGLGATNIEVGDPAVGPLADNGGETLTMLTDPGSPAINAGDPLIGAFPPTDQRGTARILGPAIDIGAVEVSAAAITSLPPARYVDTRAAGDTFDDRFQAEGRRGADSEYRVLMAGRGGVPADARAVVANVTAVGPALNGFVTVHPCVSPRPLASSLNYTVGVNLPNEIVAPLSATGELCIYTDRSINVVVDVVGYVDAYSPLEPLTPARYMDTRPAGDTFDDRNQRTGVSGVGSTTTLPVAGRGGVPVDAAAVIVNVAAVGATQRGFVTVHPCLATPPLASSLNHVANVNRANELIASVDASGNICLFTSQAIHLVVDVVGYLPAGSTYTAISPARFLDTRANGETIDDVSQREGLVGAGEEYELQIAGRPGVPAAATAVVVNVTAAGPVDRGFVTVHPCVTPRPNASSLNYVARVNGANELITQLDGDGKICLFTDQPVNLIVDVVGWLS